MNYGGPAQYDSDKLVFDPIMTNAVSLSVSGNSFILFADDRLASLTGIPIAEGRLDDQMDGLIVYHRIEAGFAMRMWNRDGTEDFCVNGMACLAYLAGEEHISVYTSQQVVSVKALQQTVVPNAGCKPNSFRLTLARPRFAARAVPVVWPTRGKLFPVKLVVRGRLLTFYPLCVGTTHAIIPVRHLPDDRTFNRIGKTLEHHRIFPERTSVIWCQQHGSSGLKLRIWERGVGETSSCGSGSIAAAIVAGRRDKRPVRRQVTTKGGQAQVLVRRFGRPSITIAVSA